MEQYLRTVAAGETIDSFSVTYDDMHGLWGGITLTLAGDGSFERVERPMGAPAPTMARVTLGTDQVRTVAALLLAITAWEQRPLDDRPPLPDESWATLTIRYGERSTRIIERHNELVSNRRIVRVRDLLDVLWRDPDEP